MGEEGTSSSEEQEEAAARTKARSVARRGFGILVRPTGNMAVAAANEASDVEQRLILPVGRPVNRE
jgi:hypothetical protein